MEETGGEDKETRIQSPTFEGIHGWSLDYDIWLDLSVFSLCMTNRAHPCEK